MRIRIGTVVAFGCLLGAGACGGSSNDDGGGGGIALSDLPDRLAHALCSAADGCWSGLLPTLLNGEDCLERTTKQLDDLVPTIEASQKAGTAKYDGNKAAACVELVQKAGCQIDSAFDSSTCRAAVDGTVEVGGSCTSDVDCVGPAYCKSAASCPGTCTAAGVVGDACEYDGQCDDGLKCDKTAQKCFQPAAEGAACGGATGPGCTDGQFCLGQDSKTGASGTCKAISSLFTAGDGATCDFSKGPLCSADYRCVVQSFGTSGIVAKCAAPVSSGAACKVAVPDECPSGEYCKVVPNTIDGTCTTLPKASEACANTPIGSDICGAYLRCVAGVCQPIQSLGASCSDDVVCYTEACQGGKCVAAGACAP